MLAAGDRAPQPRPRGTRDPERQAPNCPRCASTNTKFCYYNNYSLTQPRYFCKACRRYWTMGGSLRNVPVGGGCRRRRRSRPSKDHDLQGSPPYSRTSADHSSSDSCSSNGKAPNVQIDLAAVFATYLNPGSPLKTHPVSAPEQGCAIGVGGLDLPEQDYERFSHGMLQDGFWEPMVHLKELDSPPLESISCIMEDQFQINSTNEALSDINWSCFDLLQGYASSFQN